MYARPDRLCLFNLYRYLSDSRILETQGRMYIYGGNTRDTDSRNLSDMHCYDIERNEWNEVRASVSKPFLGCLLRLLRLDLQHQILCITMQQNLHQCSLGHSFHSRFSTILYHVVKPPVLFVMTDCSTTWPV